VIYSKFYHVVWKTLPDEALILRVMSGKATRALVDLGCGPGRVLLFAASRGWKSIGVEVDHDMIAALEERWCENPNIEIVERNIVEGAFFVWLVADHWVESIDKQKCQQTDLSLHGREKNLISQRQRFPILKC